MNLSRHYAVQSGSARLCVLSVHDLPSEVAQYQCFNCDKSSAIIASCNWKAYQWRSRIIPVPNTYLYIIIYIQRQWPRNSRAKVQSVTARGAWDTSFMVQRLVQQLPGGTSVNNSGVNTSKSRSQQTGISGAMKHGFSCPTTSVL